MAQASHPTLINLPPPASNPDTPSEMPGTPTSTTTSLSALSTTAIKDGHRGNFPPGPHESHHAHNPSTTSLEAERADRISRLAGLERVSTVRAPPPLNVSHNANSQHHGPHGAAAGGAQPANSLSPQTTPTSTQGAFSQQQRNLTPAYFDSNGQPVAVTKLSTVGTASATESHIGDDSRTTAGEADRDEDMFSTDTNYRAGSSVGADPDPDGDPMDEDRDGSRSVGGYDDRMSDDGSASLVGFGEGAGSTVSGPIYHRRAIPSVGGVVALERTNSGMSDARRDTLVGAEAPFSGFSASSLREQREARAMDGVATDQPYPGDDFADATLRGPLSPTGGPSSTSGQAGSMYGGGSPQRQTQAQMHGQTAGQGQAQTQSREAAERILQRLDHGEDRASQPLGSPGRGGEALGKFYFEEGAGKKRK